MAGAAYPAPSAGFKLWTIDPASLINEYNLGSGTMIMQRVRFLRDETITNLHCLLTATGDGGSVGFSGMGLYADDGTLRSASADDVTLFTAGAPGLRTFPLSVPQAVTADSHGWLAVLFGGGTAPKSPSTPANLIEGVLNVGARRCVYLTGQATMPGSVTIATATMNNGCHWMAAS